MRSPVRQRPVEAPPGLSGTARVDRRTRGLLARLRPGDVAVLDELDMDRATAQALVDAEVAAVVDASAIISGRFPNLGPQVLVDAGVLVVDSVGTAALGAIRDGSRVRILDGSVLVDDQEVATGRVLDAETLAAATDAARTGLVTQLESFTHNSTEVLRREQDLLLHGVGVPRLSTRVAGRPVVVVARDYDHDEELDAVRSFVREQHPVLIAVGEGVEALRAAKLRPDVVVLDGAAELPPAAVLTAARDVVVRVDRGSSPAILEQLERLGVRTVRFESAAAPEDAALVLADAAEASVVVAVGMRATLEEFLDSRRPGLAGTYLTRLKVGPRLVDASVVPSLYSGRVRPWQLALVLLAGLVALAAAVSVTPVGQEWVDDLRGPLSDLYDHFLGLFS